MGTSSQEVEGREGGREEGKRDTATGRDSSRLIPRPDFVCFRRESGWTKGEGGEFQ